MAAYSLFIVLIFTGAHCYEFDDDEYEIEHWTRPTKHNKYNSYAPNGHSFRRQASIMTFYPALNMMQEKANDADPAKYPFIARVVHSKINLTPHMCTAFCYATRIFITTSRCLLTLKVAYTNVIYKDKRFQAQAIVNPTKLTHQSFDDIGIIVVEKTEYDDVYTPGKLYAYEKRPAPPPDNFEWWKMPTEGPYKAVGYVSNIWEKDSTKSNLYDLEVVLGLDLCSKISKFEIEKGEYNVPCYHSCTVAEHESKDAKCQKYLSGDGIVVLDTKTNSLVGIATWAVYTKQKFQIPVGMAIPNSDNFNEDYECAKKIVADTATDLVAGYYQKLCDGQ